LKIATIQFIAKFAKSIDFSFWVSYNKRTKNSQKQVPVPQEIQLLK